jgi:hypothetical protein
MSEIDFKSLQTRHEDLLQKQSKLLDKEKRAFVKEVKDYIEKAKMGGSNISSSRERDQLRANLRYWANYMYSMEGSFPDTELAPSIVESSYLSPGTVRILALIMLFFVIAGLGIWRVQSPSQISTPVEIRTDLPISITQTPVPAVTTQTTEAPAPESSGFNVILSNPANGDFITPNIEFKGTFENLKIGWSIHILFIKGDKFYPAKEHFLIPDQPANTDWSISVKLTETPEEMGEAQSYSVVLAVSLDDSSRELLLESTETGIGINSLPPTVITFQETSKVFYRNAYDVIRETRLVYPYFDGNSYDLYTSSPDGSDIRQITFAQDIDEKSPKLSPDGTKIVYVRVVRATNAHSIHIMDSDGQNDREIISGGKNILEHPQWSPDSLYISYTLGDTSLSSNIAYWSIFAYQIVTGEDGNISGEPAPLILNRYHSWIPNSRDIVFNAGTTNTSTSGFVRASIDSPDALSLFFDTKDEEVQPSIRALGDGYLLTYTVIGPSPDFTHDIFAVMISDERASFDEPPIRLTRTSGGTDHPILKPDSEVIYYVRTGNIYKVELSIDRGKITLLMDTNILVVETGTVSDNPSFDINYMEAFFQIQ